MCKYCQEENICAHCPEWEPGCGQMGCTGTKKQKEAREQVKNGGACPYCGETHQKKQFKIF